MSAIRVASSSLFFAVSVVRLLMEKGFNFDRECSGRAICPCY